MLLFGRLLLMGRRLDLLLGRGKERISAGFKSLH